MEDCKDLALKWYFYLTQIFQIVLRVQIKAVNSLIPAWLFTCQSETSKYKIKSPPTLTTTVYTKCEEFLDFLPAREKQQQEKFQPSKTHKHRLKKNTHVPNPLRLVRNNLSLKNVSAASQFLHFPSSPCE